MLDVEAWRDWTIEHADLTWRVALPEDGNAVAALIEAQPVKQDRPDLFAAPVILTLVAEDFTGEIVDALYIELIAEITKITANRAGFDAYQLLLPHIRSFLHARNIRVAQMAVLPRWKRVMAASLERMGFWCIDSRFSCWVRKV